MQYIVFWSYLWVDFQFMRSDCVLNQHLKTLLRRCTLTFLVTWHPDYKSSERGL